MALRFNGFDFPGTHGILTVRAFQVNSRRQHFWGVRGTAQIVSEPSFRQITCDIWCFDSWDTPKKAQDFLDELDQILGDYGLLTNNDDQGVLVQEFNRCCFDPGYEIQQIGNSQAAIQQDISGTVEANATNYFIPLRLTFTQLRP